MRYKRSSVTIPTRYTHTTMDKKKPVNLRMKESLVADIKRTAEEMDITISHLIRTAVRIYINQQSRKEKTNEQ